MKSSAWIWVIWFIILLVIVVEIALAQEAKSNGFKFSGYDIVLEDGLKNFCIPKNDKCFERSAVCARTGKRVVCRLYRTT